MPFGFRATKMDKILCVFVDEWLCLLEGGEEKFRTAVLVQDVAIFLGKHHSRTISFPLLKASRLIVHHQEQKLECPQNLKCSRVSSQRKRERGSTGGGRSRNPGVSAAKVRWPPGGQNTAGVEPETLGGKYGKVRRRKRERRGEGEEAAADWTEGGRRGPPCLSYVFL